MAKTEQTLYEKLRREEQEEQENPAGFRYSFAVKIVIILVTIVLCGWFFPFQFETNRALSVGSSWPEKTLVAQYPFSIYKPAEQYRKEVRQAIEQTSPVYVENGRALDKIQTLLEQFEVAVSEATGFSTDSVERQTSIAKPSLLRLLELPLARRRQMAHHIVSSLLEFQKGIYASGFINTQKSFIKTPEITVRVSPTSERILLAANLVDTTMYRLRTQALMREEFNELESIIAGDLLRKTLLSNLLFSSELTEIARQMPEQSVPKTIGIVRTGETIVAKGERITELTLLKIQSYENMRLLHNEDYHPFISFFGNLGHAGLICALLILYLYFIRRKLYDDNWQVAAISLCFAAVALIAWASIKINSDLPLQYLIILPTFSMLVAILYDSRTAFYTTVTMSLMVAGVRANDYPVAFMLMVGGAFANYTVRDLRNRTQVFKSIGSILVGYSITIIAFGLQLGLDVSTIGERLALASINAVICPLLTFGFLFLIERTFNVTTDLRLLEYDNLNHPLLLELSDKAPGTYQHTLTIARLAESGARAIDANPILAKVGSYFHDIGKIAKAEYFVENQMNIGNKHDRLSAMKSAAIIRNHVEDGVELGKEYKLPQRILDFIPMHHGTMLIKYFYVKALEDGRNKGVPVKEEDFRYPGPKPNSRETAIVMLADSVEALSRTLDSNNRAELDQAIDSIIKERLLDGQFDESDLTMNDLERIKLAFIRNLVGMQHQRIKYKNIPTFPGEESQAPA